MHAIAIAKRILIHSLTRHCLPVAKRYTLPTRFNSTATTMTTTTPPTPRRGAFILLEGLDRSGKTTQTKLLAQHLNSQPQPTTTNPATTTTTTTLPPPACLLLRFPDRTTPIGVMLDSYLRNPHTTLDDRAVHLLFAANRFESATPITAHLTHGTHLVVDRYSYSGAAYTAAKGYDLQWCMTVERGLPAPDAVIFLSLAAEEAAGRGGWGEERYEKAEVQAAVRKQFDVLRQQEQKKGVQWFEVDGGSGRTIDDIATEIRQIADQTIERVAYTPLRKFE